MYITTHGSKNVKCHI